MDRWALQYRNANFICVCVLGDSSSVSLAREFGSNLQLRNCVNGFVDNQSDMPTYGQLGCSGALLNRAQCTLSSDAISVPDQALSF